jgi:hypothetical protein
LERYEVGLKFIRTTSTETGLCCTAYLDRKHYQTKLTLTNEQKESICVTGHRGLPKWNYTIRPRQLSADETDK